MDKREIYPGDATELEKVLTRGLYGNPEAKKEERLRYLGELRERLILALTENQVKSHAAIEKLEQSLDNIKTYKMIIKGNLGTKTILEYEHLAKKHGVKVTTVYNPKFKGNIGLVVVSNHALDLPDSRVFPKRPAH